MMPPQKTRKAPQDGYAQRAKKLSSTVQRLRGWVGTDPSREAELADALVELNRHRLLGHDYAAAAADAKDAVRRSAELLTAAGPLGPYTSVDDAIRYLIAVIHLAVTQAGLGLFESAGRTIATVADMKAQLKELRLEQQLDPVTVIWALSCTARGALASAEVARANAYADAALARLDESGLRAEDEMGYLAVDTDRLAADCRWAAGRPEESLGFLHQAKERYDRVVDGRLLEPASLSPGLLGRLAEPLFGIYRDMADRLVASGEVDLALVTRRELVALLRGLEGRLGESTKVQLASALTDLAADLLTSERADESGIAAAEAAKLMPNSPAAPDAARRVVPPGDRLEGWEPVPMSDSYAVPTSLAAAGRAATGTDGQQTTAWLEADRAEAHRLEHERLERARTEAARRQAEQAEAERAEAERMAEERARAEHAERVEAERQMAAEEAERLERKRRREERLEAHRLEVERREAERREAERLQAERQADRDAVEIDALRVALAEWRELQARGDRRAARAANERVVELLRPQAQTDLAGYGSQLVDALEELSRARLRSGDVWGSRAPAREAKELAKTLSR
jgi:hypothetical protein